MKPTKSVENSTMNTVAQLNGLRSAAEVLLERELRRTRSRMRAYEAVASLVGASTGWLRKFITRVPEAKEPGWIVGQAIMMQYNKLCERIETEQANERVLNEARRIAINEATGGAVEAVAVEMRGMAARARVEAIGPETSAPETETETGAA